MQCISRLFLTSAIIAAVVASSLGGSAKEFLTVKEIEKIQDAQGIDARVGIYLDAAKLRLKTAEDRLNGIESSPGDFFEFLSPEEMLDAYYRILRSIMLNLDEAFQKSKPDPDKVRRALKDLKKNTEKSGEVLQVLKKIAEEKQKEELWNLLNKAIDITDGAREGAESGLSRLPAAPADRKARGRDR